ncbi:hypothetical protein [Granulicatella balaenopterae]|nr:hypothetical protein [Granulicatella balaenopterae]
MTVLEFIKQHVEGNIWPDRFFISKGNNNGFETLIESIIPDIEHKFSDVKVNFISGHHFPDVDITIDNQKYGLELKSSQRGSWIVPGNSIFESISEHDYSEIYVLFGKKETKNNERKYEVKYCEYWQATSNIAVTHSPRFIINMNTTDSVFNTQDTYNQFRNMNESEKAQFAQQILRSKVTGTKWYITPQSDSVEVTNFNTLSKDIKLNLMTELYILFPNDLLKKRNNYSRSVKYLIEKHYIYSNNLRDVFTAGGQDNINGVLLPKTISIFISLKTEISLALEEASEEFQKTAYEYWNIVPSGNFKQDYLSLVYKLLEKEFNDEQIMNVCSDILS